MTDDQKVRVDSGATGPGMMANNDAKDKNYAEYESGLEVVETGPEVVDDKHLPEVVDSYSRYAEYKQNSPLQVAHSQPASVVSSSIPGTQPGTQPGYFPPPQSASTLDDHKYNGGQNPFLSAGKKKDGTVCGLRKKMFWAVLAVLIIGVVVAIAVGLGVGLGIKTGSTARYVGRSLMFAQVLPILETVGCSLLRRLSTLRRDGSSTTGTRSAIMNHRARTRGSFGFTPRAQTCTYTRYCRN